VLETRLPCDAETAWRAVMTTRLLHEVAAPWVRFRPLEPARLPETWSPGRYRVAMRLAGLIPLGTQWIGIEIPPPERAPGGTVHVLRDDGSGPLARVWDHRIRVAPLAEGCCRYRDEVEIQAGWPTPLVWGFAWLFFRHRQSRLRRLAARGFDGVL